MFEFETHYIRPHLSSKLYLVPDGKAELTATLRVRINLICAAIFCQMEECKLSGSNGKKINTVLIIERETKIFQTIKSKLELKPSVQSML